MGAYRKEKKKSEKSASHKNLQANKTHLVLAVMI